MVKEVIFNDKNYYRCAACGQFYSTRKLAEECQAFCFANRGKNVSNSDIGKHAVSGIADKK